MRLIPRTWWNRVAAGLGVQMIGLLITLLVATNLWSRRVPWAQTVANALVILLLVTTALLLPWITWVCPTLDAGDPDPRKLTEPRRYLRSLQQSLWMPVMFCGLIALTTVLSSFERHGSPPRYDFSPPWRGWLILAAVTATFAFLAVWLSGIARRRLLRVVAQRRLCFNCGYDLRGNPAAPCPECGWKS